MDQSVGRASSEVGLSPPFPVCTIGTGNKIIFRQAELGTLQLPADVQRTYPGEPLRQGS